MDCQEAKIALSPYIDGELPHDDAASIAAHLTVCSACRHGFEELRLVGRVLRTQLASRYTPSPDLRAKVLAALDAVPSIPAAHRAAARTWLTGSVFMLAVLVGVILTWLLAVPGKQERLVDEAISGHLRSQVIHASSDSAASDIGSPAWLAAQFDAAPTAPELAQAGYALIGARTEYMYKRKVIALAYRASGHLVSVFVWRAEPSSALAVKRLSDEGYNLALWSDGERSFCAVSDLDGEALERFASEYASRATPAPSGRSSISPRIARENASPCNMY
jgi:anti-sigma factor RsiW